MNLITCYIVAVVCLCSVLVECQPSPGNQVSSIESNLTEEELITYQAIKSIHMHLDDDRSGSVDHSESVEFLLDELKSKDKTRHSHFHGNDSLITVEDLWASWKQSEVHNWTCDDVITWLVNTVKLSEYVEIFTKNKVNGTLLPRFASDANGYMLKQIGIVNSKHRKKIALRASDVVLFGPNKPEYNYIKDVSLFILLFLATATAWYALHEKKRSRHHIEQMMKDVDCLQQAEEDLMNLQKKLALAEQEQLSTQQMKLEMESQLKEEISSAKNEAERLHRERQLQEEGQGDVQLLERELQETKRALAKVEAESEMLALKSPHVLQQWLQMTYKKEGKHFQLKKLTALKQMEEAKIACDKISKKRNGLLGSLRLAQGQSIDEVDQKILGARSALAEVTNELEERQHRWQQIELLCGFAIAHDHASTGKPVVPNTNRRRSSIAQALASCGNAVGMGSIPSTSESLDPTGDLSQNGSHYSSRHVIVQHVLSAPGDGKSDCQSRVSASLNPPQTLSLNRTDLKRSLSSRLNASTLHSSQSDDALLKGCVPGDGGGKSPRLKRNRNTWSAGTPSPSESFQVDLNGKQLAESSGSSSQGSQLGLNESQLSTKRKGSKKLAKMLSSRRTSDHSKESTCDDNKKRNSLFSKLKSR